MNSGQIQRRFKCGHVRAAYATCCCDPAQAFLCDFQRGFAGEHAGDGGLSRSIEALNRFLVQLAFGSECGAAMGPPAIANRCSNDRQRPLKRIERRQASPRFDARPPGE